MQYLQQGRTAQILSKFRDGLREELRTELLVREITELRKAYIIVQDLDSYRSNYNTRSFDSNEYDEDFLLFPVQ